MVDRRAAAFCVLLLAIVAAAAEEPARPSNVTSATTQPHPLVRREAIVLDNTPIESNLYRKQSNVVYRRVSKVRGHSYPIRTRSKPRYGPPRPKYGPPRNPRRPPKKHRGKPMKTKYGNTKSRVPKKNFRQPPKTRFNKDVNYRPPKTHAPYVPQEPAGFGEPPSDRFKLNHLKPAYGEPPTDSYGAPLRSPTQHGSGDSYEPNTFGSHSYSNIYAPESHGNFPPSSVNQASKPDSYSPNLQDFPSNSYSGFPREPTYAASTHPQHSVVGSNFVVSNDNMDAGNDNGPPMITDVDPYYTNHYTNYVPQAIKFHTQTGLSNPRSRYKLKGKKVFMDPEMSINGPIKGPKGKKYSNEIIVGGQYAEPPARYVPKFKPSAQMYTEDDSFTPPVKMALDSDESASAYQSSYVNYKNSNMAFSPQNLNDAFSIVD